MARANGKQLGRAKFVVTPERQQIIDAWKALPKDERGPLRELAAALKCSVGKAHQLAKGEE